MPSSLFFARLVPNRPDFPMNMTAEEQATMGAHGEFLVEQFKGGKLVVSGPVFAPTGAFGIAVFEAESIDEVRGLLARDPANAIGRYEVAPMGPSNFRPARPA